MDSKMCKIAVGQMTSTSDKIKNLEKIKKIICTAKNNNAKILFLPEACDYIADNKQDVIKLAEPLDGPLMKNYQELAKNNNLWLSLGGVHEVCKNKDELKTYNSHVILNNCGDIVAVYRKLHLFDVSIPEDKIRLMESDLVNPGSKIIPPVETPAGLVGMAICYDLRFPEMAVALRVGGADILTYPSAFTHATGSAHWQTLLQARAIESQCYVIAAAQVGPHNKKRISYGQALVVDPWGKILAECSKYNSEKSEYNPETCIVDIDLSKVADVRKKMPVFDHRRPDSYNLPIKTDFSESSSYNFGSKDIPSSTVFYKTPLSYAFTNLRCVVPGHVLVATLREAKHLTDLTSVEINDLFQTVVKVQTAIQKKYSASSATIAIQDGEDAGQTIKHVHVHVMPRKVNDFEENDEVYEKLASHDKGPNMKPPRDLSEMAKEADELKQYFQ